jgi:hypothetical protein
MTDTIKSINSSIKHLTLVIKLLNEIKDSDLALIETCRAELNIIEESKNNLERKLCSLNIRKIWNDRKN